MGTYNQLRRRRLPEAPGSVVGLPYVDIADAAFQAAALSTTAITYTLPAAGGAGDVPPALRVPAAGVGGTEVISVIRRGAALDAGLGFAGAQVVTAGGPGVGQITLYVVNPTAAAIPVAPAARTFRFYLDQ